MGVGGERVDQRVLRGDDRVRHTEARVGTGREHADAQVGATFDGEVELGTLGAPDPIALHDLGSLGPLEIVEGVEQLVRVLRDPEEPLLEVALDDQVAGPFTGAVREHLLVGQDRLATRTPVHRRCGTVGEARLPQPEEDQLRPLDVLGVMAPYLPPPVVDGTEADQGGLELGNSGLGEDPGVGACLDGGVLGRQTERVEPDRRQDSLPLHGLVPNGQVTEGVVADVALMGRAGGVGVHAQRVELLPGVVVVDLIRACIGPVPLPLALHLVDVIGACHATRVGDDLDVSEHRRGIDGRGLGGR